MVHHVIGGLEKVKKSETDRHINGVLLVAGVC